jgi:hypothetical protein
MLPPLFTFNLQGFFAIPSYLSAVAREKKEGTLFESTNFKRASQRFSLLPEA